MQQELENQLCLHHGKMVAVVRPYFGTQSDSFAGELSVHAESHPIIFQVISPAGIASIFMIDDVNKITETIRGEKQDFIIRLKGPKEYPQSL